MHRSVILNLVLVILRVQISEECKIREVGNDLMEGCKNLIGLNVTAVGGTIVNDHNCDVILPKQVFIEEPSFQYNAVDTKQFYTIMMIDPNAAPQLTGEFYLHLLRSNVPGSALKSQDSPKSGTDYRIYKPPTPPRGDGLHRYMMLLYEQNDSSQFIPHLPRSRARFNLEKWLVGKKLCGPVAATQFRAQF